MKKHKINITLWSGGDNRR